MVEQKRRTGIKIIKKTGRFLAWLFGFLFLLTLSLYIGLKSPRVQTWLAQKGAAYLSSELKTKVTIRAVDIEFFKTVNLKGIYIEDQHQDTLLYADNLEVNIHRFDYDNHYLSISSVKLSDSKIKLKKYAGQKGLSYRFILQYFKSSDTTKTAKSPWKVDLYGVQLERVSFAFIDTRDTVNDPGMDYENIQVKNISANVTDIDQMGDSLSLRIKGLKGEERCGLALKDFSTRLTISDSLARLDNLHFITKGSSVDGFISFYFNNSDDIADDFIHLVKMDGHFSNSVIEMGDIAYFSPSLLGIHKKVLLTGDVKGTVEHLKCRNIDLRFGEKSHIAGNFSFNGLPDMNQTDMNFKIREAVTNKKDLEGTPVAPFEKGNHLNVDDRIGKLGDMVFAGTFEGFLNDFVARGSLHTDLGSLTLKDLAMVRESDSAQYAYNGQVLANQFNVGSFFDIPDLSYVSGDVKVNGAGLTDNTINAKIDGTISQLVYHNYSYTNISVTNGKLRRQVFDGDFKVDDPNVKIGFNGSIDNSQALPHLHFDVRIDSANLGALGFVEKGHENMLSASIHTDFTGNNIDNINGQMDVDSLRYVKDGERFTFNEFNLYAGSTGEKTNAQRTLSLRSDIVWVTLKGEFQLLQLPHAVSDVMSVYLPAYFPPDNPAEAKKDPVQKFSWTIIFQNNTKPLQALVPGLKVAPLTLFKGDFNGQKKIFNASFNSPSVVYKDIGYDGIIINADNTSKPGICLLTGHMDSLKVTDTLSTKDISLECRAFNDSLYTDLSWNNHTQKKNDANILALIRFKSPQSVGMSFLNTGKDSTYIHLGDSLWTVQPANYIHLDTNRIHFHDLVFRSGNQSIGFDGLVSHKPSEQLTISMKNFNIAYLNFFSKQKGLTLSGFISSETTIADLYETPVFTSNSNFRKFWINDQMIGDGDLDAVWQAPKQAVYIHGRFANLFDSTLNQPIDNIIFEGFYYPKNKTSSIDINATFNNVNLSVLQPLLKDYCSVMNGQLAGDLHIGGTLEQPLLSGKMAVNFRMVRVDYLGLALRSAVQPVYIEENSFFFDDYKVIDEYGDTAKIYGHLFHHNFANFQFDMDFSFDHFMVLNTNASQNELYYGRVFASGYMNVSGFVNERVRIDMEATTDKIYRNGQPIYSEFNIPISDNSSDIGSSDFITFVSKASPLDSTKSDNQLRDNGVELHLIVHATNDAYVKVIFDKTVGDELTAYGAGDLKMDISPAGDFSIFGQYVVEKGSYLFTMKNIVYVPFSLSKGGMIRWNGDPLDAQINADAVYKTNASVEPFFPTDSTNKDYHRTYPVQVVMHMDNRLMNPDVAFDINLPTADQNIQETVRSYTQTELERNRQVLSLMVLNSFTTPSELTNGTASGPNYGGAGSTLLSNFVSGTMNNWLSQISSDVNVGVVYRPNDDLSTQDLKVLLATQLLNNRITVDVAGGRVNANQATVYGGNGQWVGDVNVEYKVTDDGKVRLRAFNRSNDYTVLNSTSPYTQGVGVFYREEFENGKELKKRYRDYFTKENPNREKKKEEPPLPVNPKATPPPSPQTTPPDSTSTK